MNNIYIGLSDKFVANKLLNYLQIYFDNVMAFDSSVYIRRQSVIVVDLEILQENTSKLQDANIIVLLDNKEKASMLPVNCNNLYFLDIPIKLQDLIDLLEIIEVSIAKIYSYNDFLLDLNNRLLYNDISSLNLSDKEASILKEFFTKPSQSISKQHFMKEVWNIANEAIESQSLENYISSLRRKFQENNINLQVVKNKDGYELN